MGIMTDKLEWKAESDSYTPEKINPLTESIKQLKEHKKSLIQKHNERIDELDIMIKSLIKE